MGYHWAGFAKERIVGVDLMWFRHYPFKFVRGGVFELLPKLLHDYPITHIHASPPCQLYSIGSRSYVSSKPYADYIPRIRELLDETDLPYVIENVEYAPLIKDRCILLCGSMQEFQSNVPMTKSGALRVLRHRLFESNIKLVQPEDHLPNFPKYQVVNKHPYVHTTRKQLDHFGKLDPYKDFVMVAGGGNAPAEACRDAMGIDWMNRDELCEAIPPAYTRYIGKQLLEHHGDFLPSIEFQLSLF
jgi:DNA (cytosine-5)-methyltransferase 1